MRARDLHNSVWSNNEGETAIVSKVKGGYYLDVMEYDAEFRTAKETFAFFKENKFKHIGYE